MVLSFLRGGDFNCTENPHLCRNHPEPHPASAHVFRELTESWELAEVWRTFNMKRRQFTYIHSMEIVLSLARLDHFYCFKHHLNIFNRCFINPVGLSNHYLGSCHVFIKSVQVKSAYWHLNTALLNNQAFRNTFTFFWLSHRESRPAFANL